MPFNNAALTVGANAIRSVITHGQLHAPGGAGVNGTDNLTTATRAAITWTAVTGSGNWGLSISALFTGGAANGPISSITVWSAPSGGTFYGEFPLSGDIAFSASGAYSLTAFDLTGSSTTA